MDISVYKYSATHVKIFTSLAKEVVFGGVGLPVCLFICLFVCDQHYSKSYEQIGMKVAGGVLGSTMKN